MVKLEAELESAVERSWGVDRTMRLIKLRSWFVMVMEYGVCCLLWIRLLIKSS